MKSALFLSVLLPYVCQLCQGQSAQTVKRWKLQVGKTVNEIIDVINVNKALFLRSKQIVRQSQQAIQQNNQLLRTIRRDLRLTTIKYSRCGSSNFSWPRPERHVAVLPSGLKVLCDTVTDNGRWIIFQRRASGDVDFYLGQQEYTEGFGDLRQNGSFWLGLENIHALCGAPGQCELRIDLQYPGDLPRWSPAMLSADGQYFAHYSDFYLGDEAQGFSLHVDGYSGTAGDGLAPHNSQRFATHDSPRRFVNCASLHQGAWWYAKWWLGSCGSSNLNGRWAASSREGLVYRTLSGRRDSVTFTEMKLRQLPRHGHTNH